MKKSLVALAVLAASGAAMAQSNVTVYGLADLWFGSTKVETSGANLGNHSIDQTKVDSGGVATSRWGIMGSEDLGGGLKANLKLEQGFNLDTGAAQAAASAFNRQAWVGFSGGFGEAQFGRVWNSYDDIRSSANDTFNANVSASFNTWLGYNDRTSSGLKYLSPVYNGFSGSFTYSFGEDKTQVKDASDILSLGVQYAKGPLFVAYAHQQQKQNGVNGVFSAVPGILGNVTAALNLSVAERAALDAGVRQAVASGETKYNLLNGSYDFGAAKLIAGYNNVKQTIDGSKDLNADEYNLGVEVPLSANLKLGGGYAQLTVDQAGTDQFKSTGYSAALVYTLSKRTLVYGALTQTKLESSASNDELKSTLYAVGVQHRF